LLDQQHKLLVALGREACLVHGGQVSQLRHRG
jgi:hypothetical protein